MLSPGAESPVVVRFAVSRLDDATFSSDISRGALYLDFVKVGMPLNLLILATAVTGHPLFWDFGGPSNKFPTAVRHYIAGKSTIPQDLRNFSISRENAAWVRRKFLCTAVQHCRESESSSRSQAAS